MSSIIESIRGAVQKFYFTNLHFDVLVTTFSVIAWAGGFRCKANRGLLGFAVTVGADRAIMALGGVSIQRDGYEDKSFQARWLQIGWSALAEEGVLYNLYLDTQKGVGWTILRVVISIDLSIRAVRAIRHPGDLKTQDRIDSGLGLAWALGREIVIQNTQDKQRLGFAIFSNSLIFGLIEAGKMPSHFVYKFASSVLFRTVCGISALRKDWAKHPSFIAPFVTHLFFNLSRSF